ncbi:unnamed protein product [Symbiodinium sp. CCMP2592]|nr:unnamed protein product [Symbiodinium sp. CCMP2592]
MADGAQAPELPQQAPDNVAQAVLAPDVAEEVLDEAADQDRDWGLWDSVTGVKLGQTAVADALGRLVKGVDLKTVRCSAVCQQLAAALQIDVAAVTARRAEIEQLLGSIVQNEAERQLAERISKRRRVDPAADEVLREMQDRSLRARTLLLTFAAPSPSTAVDGRPLQDPGVYSRREIRELAQSSLAKAQPAVRLLKCAVFREAHSDGRFHFHMCCQFDRPVFWNLWRQHLREHHALACSFQQVAEKNAGYHTMIRYCYVPSQKKRLETLDGSPDLWSADGPHPPLYEAMNRPSSATTVSEDRTRHVQTRAAQGKAPARVNEMHFWPILVRHQLRPEQPDFVPRLCQIIKASGDTQALEFLAKNMDSMQDIGRRLWMLENAEAELQHLNKTRLDLTVEAARTPCSCQGVWLHAARERLATNGLDPASFWQCIYQALRDGRRKGNTLCLTGRYGNEGKSSLLRPLFHVFPQSVFTSPTSRSFPLIMLPRKRVVFLDDWRWNGEIIPMNQQLLWLEGAALQISVPQNTARGHIEYADTAPIFVTCSVLELEVCGKHVTPSDFAMLQKRLRVFHFSRPLERPMDNLVYCASCWSRCVLHGTPEWMQVEGPPPAIIPAPSAGSVASEAADHAPPPQDATEPEADVSAAFMRKNCVNWTVQDVPDVERSGLDGGLISCMSWDELRQDLNWTALQMKKFARFWDGRCVQSA